jgi:hypothetical protein
MARSDHPGPEAEELLAYVALGVVALSIVLALGAIFAG